MEHAREELLTAKQFEEIRPDLAEGGRWMELNAGRVVQFDPPDPMHGNVVLNLSKAMAAHIAEHAAERPGYTCFELGLLVKRDPDTVHFPPVSYFSGGTSFVETDKIYTDVVPRLVVEIASTNSRRRGLTDRVAAYQRWGVEAVWIVDTNEKQVHVVRAGQPALSHSSDETLSGDPMLPGFRIPVAEIFATPSWWK